MERSFAVEFDIYKGAARLSATPKTVYVGLDDLEPGLDEETIRHLAIDEAVAELRRTKDSCRENRQYGENWVFRAIYDA